MADFARTMFSRRLTQKTNTLVSEDGKCRQLVYETNVYRHSISQYSQSSFVEINLFYISRTPTSKWNL